MTSGIYIITAPNGKQYVGSASSLSTRKAVHWGQLKAGTHHNRHLQRSWDKYDGAGFDFRVVLLCAKKDLLMYEQLLLDGLSPAFNICTKAGSSLGVQHTPKTKEKYAEAMRRRIARDPTTHRRITENANARTRALHQDPSWRAGWERSVRAHGETMARMITWQGRTQSVTKWAEEIGVPRTTLKHRIRKYGVEAAFATPTVAKHSPESWVLRNQNRGVALYFVDGRPLTKTAFAAHIGVSRVTLRDWEKRGLSQPQMELRAKQ